MDRQASPDAKANSLGRLQALEKLTREVPQTPEGVKEMMSTHSSPARICQHKGVDGAALDTDMALVFVPQERTIYYSKGHPCESGYEEVRI